MTNEENRLVQERIRKTNELRELGVNPYPYSYNPTHKSIDIKKKHEKLKAQEHTDDEVCVAGRIILFRRMGKVAFLSIRDEEGDIQVYAARDILNNEKYEVVKKLDMGDIVGVKGKIFCTKTGEVTIEATELVILTKSLQPLPDKHKGLKEKEIRYRQRYVDLIVNPQVREILKKRSLLTKAVRDFMHEKGFIEVETPLLQTQYHIYQDFP